MTKKGMSYAEAIKDMQKRKERAMKEAMLMIEADAKLTSPVLTGTLRRSLTHEITQNGDELIGTVGTNLEYAGKVEYQYGFLEGAVDRNLENIRQRIAEVLRNG